MLSYNYLTPLESFRKNKSNNTHRDTESHIFTRKGEPYPANRDPIHRILDEVSLSSLLRKYQIKSPLPTPLAVSLEG